MRPIAKPFLFLAALLLGLAALATVVLNLFLQSGNTRQLLCKGLSDFVGAPVSVGSIFALPLGGIRLRDVSATNNGHSLLSIETVIIQPDYLALLHGRLSATGITIRNPVVHWPSGEIENLALNVISHPSGTTLTTMAPLESSQTVPAIVSTSPTSITLTAVQEPAVSRDTLKSIGVTGGEFTLDDPQGVPLITLSGVTLKGKHDSTGEWTGRLETKQSAFGTGFILCDLNSPVTITDDLKTITLAPLVATLGGGELDGRVLLDTGAITPNYTLSLNLQNASLGQLLSEASLGNSSAEGNIDGTLDLSGIVGSRSGMKGKGSLQCDNTTVQPANFLRQIGQILQVEELQLLRISKGKLLFHVDAEKITVDDLSLKSENLILTAQGPVSPSGEVDLKARLLFNEKMSSRLRGLLGSQLGDAPEPGYSQIPFRLSGPIQNPRTDLLERLTGIHMGGDLGGFLQGFFGNSPTH